MITLYTTPVSIPALIVKMSAVAVGVQFEEKHINLRKREGRTPEYLKIHPAGKVPALTDGDFTVFETSAIARYLAEKTESPLYPANLEARTLVNQWCSFIQSHLLGAVGKILFNTYMAPAIGTEVDERSLAEGKAWFQRYAKVINKHLSNSPYFVGEQQSLAELFLVGTLLPMEALEIDLSSFPAMKELRESLTKEPFYTSCNIEYEMLLASFAKYPQPEQTMD